MKRLLIFFITGLFVIAAVGIAGCVSEEETPAAPISTSEPTSEPVSLNVQASWINNNLRVQGTADLPDGEVVTVEVYDTYVSKNIPDEAIPMSDGSILTYTSEGIFRTMDVTVSHGEYVAIFEGIGSDILKGESLRVRTLYQGSVSNEVNPVKTTDWTDDYAPVSTPAPTVKTDTTTMGERNAAQKALDYLRFAAFSREGLIEQLEFEGFSHEEAVYGVDQSGADWNEQAALKAQSYLDYSSFSREGLIEQLVFEGFTRQQAEYGVQAVGY